MKTRCDFCYRECALGEGQRGVCHIRVNRNGAIVTENYGEVVALALDPIEKKPLYHFKPGSYTLSVALFGCNLSCSFCQNYSISQKEFHSRRSSEYLSPEELVRQAVERKVSVSFTYSEPIVWQDYLLDCARIASDAAIPTILVSSGTFSKASLSRILPFIDAYSIDLKGDESFYRRYCSGSMKPVIRSLEILAKTSATVEVTTLLIEGEHTLSDVKELGTMLREMGIRVWHLSRYHPAYKLDLPATSESFLREALAVAKELKIPHVYGGNSHQDRDTRCPECGALLVKRYPHQTKVFLKEGKCTCSHQLYGDMES
ncbi:MAG: AmmeMemoRadiSam system radical SAM enzyme [Spirochaetales bacterium]|nr:AmmeMemoRadiSam system radical SAM enzyme [Spirochaetales bacterium]